MKRILSFLLVLAILVSIPAAASFADNEGELLITTDPETVTGAVGDVVKVNFYLYPNLPDNRLFDSIQGSLIYDAEKLTLGSINLEDEEANLKSLMKSKSPMWMPYEKEKGTVNFAYIDAYGTNQQGFWFQVEFRIEAEGASAFIFNGIRYSGIDQETKKPKDFYINPVQVGGIATEGQTVPTDAAADVTYAPLTAAVEPTAVPATPTPKPHNDGNTVPVTTSLPISSEISTIAPTATPAAATNAPSSSAGSNATPKPSSGNADNTAAATEAAPSDNTTATAAATEAAPSGSANATSKATAKPNNTSKATAKPNDTSKPADTTTPTEATAAPVDTVEPNEGTVTDEPLNTADPTTSDPSKGNQTVEILDPVDEPIKETETPEPQPEKAKSNTALTIAVIAGIVVVILLAVLAIVLILIRKKKMDAMNDEE